MKILYLISFFLLVIPTIHGQLDWQDTDGPPGNLYLDFYMHGDSTYATSHNTLYRYVDDSMQWQEVAEERVDFISSYGDKAIAASVYDQDEIIIKQSVDKSRSWDTICAFSGDSVYFEDLAIDSVYYYLLLNPINPNHSNISLRAKHGSCEWDTLTTPKYFRQLEYFSNRLYGFSYNSLHYSDDQGSSWTKLHSNPPNIRNFIENVIARDSFIMIGKEKSIIYSFDFGANWYKFVSDGWGVTSYFTFLNDTPYALVNNELYAILGVKRIELHSVKNLSYRSLFPLNETIGTNVLLKGVYRWSPKEEQFIPSFRGINEGYIYDLSFQEDTLYALTAAGLFRYDMRRNQWIDQIYSSPQAVDSWNATTSEAGWMVIINFHSNGFLLSKNWGKKWKFIRHDFGLAGYEKELLVIKDTILFFTNYYLGRSTDGGQTIEDLRQVHAKQQGVVSFREKLYVIFNDVLYVGDELGLSWDSVQLKFSADKLIPSENYLIAQEHIYPLQYNFHYSRNGTDWLDLKLPLNSPKDPRYYPIVWSNKDLFYLSASDTLYSSADQGNSWSILDVDPPNDRITAHDSLLFTYYYGLFRAVIPDQTTHANSPQDISADFSMRCFPNPTSRSINISVQTEDRFRDLHLLLFDNNGRLLYQQEMLSQSGIEKMDVSHVPPGTYYLLGISPSRGMSGQKIIIQ